MMSMKKSAACAALICIMLCVGCGKTAVTYNSMDSIYDATPMNIEGAYTAELGADEFETLTGLSIRQSLPSTYQSESMSAYAEYDKDGGIINIQGSISHNGGYIAFSAFSDKLWSNLSYAPNFYRYGDDGSNNLVFTTIGGIEVLFFYYDDSKEKEYKLGYDVYISDFDLNGINVYVESNAMSQNEFEQFVTSLIETAQKGE